MAALVSIHTSGGEILEAQGTGNAAGGKTREFVSTERFNRGDSATSSGQLETWKQCQAYSLQRTGQRLMSQLRSTSPASS